MSILSSVPDSFQIGGIGPLFVDVNFAACRSWTHLIASLQSQIWLARPHRRALRHLIPSGKLHQ